MDGLERGGDSEAKADVPQLYLTDGLRNDSDALSAEALVLILTEYMMDGIEIQSGSRRTCDQ